MCVAREALTVLKPQPAGGRRAHSKVVTTPLWRPSKVPVWTNPGQLNKCQRLKEWPQVSQQAGGHALAAAARGRPGHRTGAPQTPSPTSKCSAGLHVDVVPTTSRTFWRFWLISPQSWPPEFDRHSKVVATPLQRLRGGNPDIAQVRERESKKARGGVGLRV